MQFQRLRLSGFKSFVEPTEFRIEPGLTGVVGPNGCGKSNLLEALRWVMGASSARAMRAGGMEDVIFGGTGSRPARNHAEVSLQIGNVDHRAPAKFNDHAVIEVTRRIERGAGSTYRVNGVETRARDVHLLFADASTGANSPALVRQNQVSELIGAKPTNRRRILEEAAGVSGLYARRQEAHLKLNAAEANLARLEDVSREIETALNRLRREARQAGAYRRIAADIRSAREALLHARWSEARDAAVAAVAALTETELAVQDRAREATRATAAALAADEAVKPLREEATIAQAVLQRLELERDRIDRAAEEAGAELARLAEARRRNAADLAREAQIEEDAAEAIAALKREIEELEARVAATPARLSALQETVEAAAAERAAAEAEVERLAAEAAAQAARRDAERARIEQVKALARAAADRLVDAERRVERARHAAAQAASERADLALQRTDAGDTEAELQRTTTALQSAQAARDAAEHDRIRAMEAEAAARDASARVENDLARLRAEADGLAQLVVSPDGRFPPAMDRVRCAPGLEAAVAAALAGEADASLDARAASFWGPASEVWIGEPTTWPDGALALTDLVEAPDALAARLAMTALVDRDDGAMLQGFLPVGARLVSREGDLWRWDGFTSRAEAPRPAALRLQQRARLAEVEERISRLASMAGEASAAHGRALSALHEAERIQAEARTALRAAELAAGEARQDMERLWREASRLDARMQALDEAIARLDAELAEASTAAERSAQEAQEATLAAADPDHPPVEPGLPTGALDEARRRLTAAREAETSARSKLDAEGRAEDGRRRRQEDLRHQALDWTRRADGAARRMDELKLERLRVETAEAAAHAMPAEIHERRERLLGEVAAAERRVARAADALALGEAASDAGDRAARSAEADASKAREARAAATARVDAARDRLDRAAAEVRETAHVEPEALAERLAETAPADPAELEQRLAKLERDRDALGAVNLRAEEEAEEHGARLDALNRDRDDLASAIATLRAGIEELNAEGRDRLLAAFEVINGHFRDLFATLFAGGQADLRLAESDDPLEAGLEIYACPPGKRLAAMSLLSGGEQALIATALIFAVFLANPAPVCVLDEVDAPLDDANVDRFCRLLDEMRRRTDTRFIAITHNPVTMSRMDRLFGVTMAERGVSQLVSVDLRQAEAMAAQ